MTTFHLFLLTRHENTHNAHSHSTGSRNAMISLHAFVQNNVFSLYYLIDTSDTLCDPCNF